jgi:hypothetical protein
MRLITPPWQPRAAENSFEVRSSPTHARLRAWFPAQPVSYTPRRRPVAAASARQMPKPDLPLADGTHRAAWPIVTYCGAQQKTGT